MAAEKKALEGAAKAELARFLGELADKAYREVEVDVVVPDGPMSSDEVDALLAGLRAIAAQTNGRVRFWRNAADLAKRLGLAAARGGL